VLSLPPAFALSQDQTLKLDLNFEPADHIVLTRSHHTKLPKPKSENLSPNNLLPALHSADNDGVNLCIKTCTAEVFRPAPSQKAEAFIKRDPQGLRRPRFSFFNLTCQTTRCRSIALPLREENFVLIIPSGSHQAASRRDCVQRPEGSEPIGRGFQRRNSFFEKNATRENYSRFLFSLRVHATCSLNVDPAWIRVNTFIQRV
jgi:hypothetical protein